MKRCITVMLSMLLVVGCSAKTAQPLPQMKSEQDPAQLAGQVWADLSENWSAQPITADTACLLLDFDAADIVSAYGWFDPEAPQTAQLFLLQASPDCSKKVYDALEQRLELVRQTASAWHGMDSTSTPYGCLLAAGEWCALLVPDDMDDQRTQQARRTLMEAFE